MDDPFQQILPDEADGFSLEEKARRRILPDDLSILEITTLMYNDPLSKKNATKNLIKACEQSKIKFYGNINGWRWGNAEYGKNLFPGIKGRWVDGPGDDPIRSHLYGYYEALPGDCVINRNDFESYLHSVKFWPLKESMLLANWFLDSNSSKASCGKHKIHKLIYRAFDSITKPANLISTDDVISRIRNEWNDKKRIPSIDQDSIIREISADKTIQWINSNGGITKTTYRQIDECVKKLKSAINAD